MTFFKSSVSGAEKANANPCGFSSELEGGYRNHSMLAKWPEV